MTTNDPAPAVAVGVQPEPAGDCAVHVLPNPNCNTCRAAVPVVHPEPGDRAEDGLLHKGTSDFKLADALLPLLLLWGSEDEADEDVDQYDITNAAINHLRQRPPAEFALLFPSQVAAAVAAVRADTDETIERYRKAAEDQAETQQRKVGTMRAWAEDYKAQRDVLAGQVAAIRALHGKVPEPFLDGERYSCSTCTDGEGNAIDWPCPTLVASSPTTPEATK